MEIIALYWELLYAKVREDKNVLYLYIQARFEPISDIYYSTIYK